MVASAISVTKKFIETEKARFSRHFEATATMGSSLASRRATVSLVVNVSHELVEVRPAFLLDRRLLEEHIHQHGLAAPDRGRKCRGLSAPPPRLRVKKEKKSVRAGGV